MYRLAVFYPYPVDIESFRSYYISKHLPLARKLPNVRAMTYSLDLSGVGSASPYFAIWEADFDSVAEMEDALASSIGQQLTEDVPNYATGGAVIIHYPLGSADED